ncbi:MAG TPA: hypothetical protein PLQ20_01985 [Candidatus Paceibacterota bacterium]|nr:hypothetical protein [Candidatus Paceibacterota bacterium]
MKNLFDKQTSKRLSTKKSDFLFAYLPLDLVIRFPQVRETFEQSELQELADDIANDDVIQPSIVFRFSEKDFYTYVEILNKISNTRLNVDGAPFEQDSKGARWFYVLIAGERRFRAHKLLWDEGCSDCKKKSEEQNTPLKIGECYKKHDVLVYGKIKVNMGINQKLERAKSIQFRENLYVKPPVEQEAQALRNYYNYLKEIENGLTISGFAKKVGFSAERVKKAIWFCDLPSKIKMAVKEKLISYGNALEVYKITQIQNIDPQTRARIVDQETDYLLIHPKIKVEDYRIRVKSIIESFQTLSLFDLNSLAMNTKQKRKVVERNSIQALVLYSGYLDKVSLLRFQGVIGKGKMFSEESPTKWLQKILQNVQNLGPTVRNGKILKLFSDLDTQSKPAS